MGDRDKLIELMASQQIINAEFCNNLHKQNPLLFNLMWEKFKAFLTDSYFTDFERQIRDLGKVPVIMQAGSVNDF